MIAVFVRHKDNPEFRGTAFARDWTELFWVIDETFGDPYSVLVAPHNGYGALCAKSDKVTYDGYQGWEPDYSSLADDDGSVYGLSPYSDDKFVEMDWDYVRAHNIPPAEHREAFETHIIFQNCLKSITYIGTGKQYRDTACHTVVQCVTQ